MIKIYRYLSSIKWDIRRTNIFDVNNYFSNEWKWELQRSTYTSVAIKIAIYIYHGKQFKIYNNQLYSSLLYLLDRYNQATQNRRVILRKRRGIIIIKIITYEDTFKMSRWFLKHKRKFE